MTTIAYLTSDLIFQSRVASLVSALGKRLVADRVPDKLIEKLTGVSDVQLAIVDLSLGLADLASVIASIRECCPQAITVAYGPHVHEARLQQALEVGFDQVMARGQFDRQMHSLIATEASDA